MNRAGSAAIAVLLVSFVGCYSNTIEPSAPPNPSASATTRPTLSPTPSPTFEPVVTLPPPVVGANELLYACDRIAFPPSALASPGGDELLDHPAALALRQVLANDTFNSAVLPDSGWHVLGETFEYAEFGRLISASHDDSAKVFVVRFDRIGRRYRINTWYDCWPKLALPPSQVALEWVLPDDRLPDPGAAVLDLDVLTEGCFGGPMSGTIETLRVSVETNSITITLVAPFLEGTLGCDVPCGPLMPTRFELTLPEPNGGRELLDGTRFPAKGAAVVLGRGCGG